VFETFRRMTSQKKGTLTTGHKSGKCLNSLGECIYARIDLLVCRSQWPHGLRRRSTAARLLRFWVRIPPRAWMLSVVSVACCQVEVSTTHTITRPEESYRLWCVVVCDLETSRMGRPWATLGRSATRGGGVEDLPVYAWQWMTRN